jgi:hypothetical protein
MVTEFWGTALRIRGGGAVILGWGALGLVLASCSSAPSASSRSTTTSSSSTTTTIAPSSTTSTQPGPHNCSTGDLAVTLGLSSGAAGTIGQVIVFQNKSGTACLLHGFPGVAGLDGAGNQVAQATREVNQVPFTGSTASLPTVTLAPGATASALVLTSDVPVGAATSCASYAGLLVTPPNAFQSVHLTVSLPACSGLRVGPVYPGTTGMSS